jgi:hypothetical protein
MTPTCHECGQAIDDVRFTIKYQQNDWSDGYLCSEKCLADFIVVAEAEALLDAIDDHR